MKKLISKNTKRVKGLTGDEVRNGKFNIEQENISDACYEFNKIFSANSNILRYTPWNITGLLVCEIRILYTLYTLKVYGDKLIKVNKLDGTTTGEYHPHGSVYGSIVGMAQPWGMNLPYIRGEGNFGDAAGGVSAAGRYIECSMSEYAYDCFFSEFNAKINDMKPSYTGDRQEPNFILPTKYPNVLINGIVTVGKGISPSIFPCNFNEVCDATIKLMDDPDANVWLYPDFPSGCSVIDEGQFPEICSTGKGKYVMRGETEITETEDGRPCIIIKSTPQGTKLNNITKKIVELVDTKVLTGIAGFIDENTEEKIHYTIILKENTDPYKILNILYKKTRLQDSQHVDMITVDNYNVQSTNMRQILLDWIDNRIEYKRRYLNSSIVKLYERLHILEIILFVYGKNNAEKTIQLIRKSTSKKDAIEKLMKEYKITSLQAQTVISMELYDFSPETMNKYRDEKGKIEVELRKLTDLVSKPSNLKKEIKKELLAGKEKYGRPRITKVITTEGDQLVRNSNHTIVITEQGLIKKLPEKTTTVGNLRDGDKPKEIIHISNLADMILFSSDGVITKISISDIPDHDLKSVGTKLTEFGVAEGKKIIEMKLLPSKETVEKMKDKPHILFITKNGLCKMTPLMDYMSIKTTLNGISIKDDDELVGAKIVGTKKSDIIVYTNDGWGTRRTNTKIPIVSRAAKGSPIIKLEKGQTVIGFDIVDKKDKGIFILTNIGNGKISELKSFPTSDNGELLRLTSLFTDEKIVTIRTVKPDTTLAVYTTNEIIDINISDLEVMPRMAKCKKLVKLGRSNSNVIIDVKERK